MDMIIYNKNKKTLRTPLGGISFTQKMYVLQSEPYEQECTCEISMFLCNSFSMLYIAQGFDLVFVCTHHINALFL